jgi:hypothetical protein
VTAITSSTEFSEMLSTTSEAPTLVAPPPVKVLNVEFVKANRARLNSTLLPTEPKEMV